VHAQLVSKGKITIEKRQHQETHANTSLMPHGKNEMVDMRKREIVEMFAIATNK